MQIKHARTVLVIGASRGNGLEFVRQYAEAGERIMVTLLYALKARGLKKGLATLCIGGGEGTAVALELL